MNPHFLPPLADELPPPLNRRHFLAYTTLAALGVLHAPLVQAQSEALEATASAQTQHFHRLATWITAKPNLDPILSAKAMEAVQALTPHFSATLEQLMLLASDETSLNTVLVNTSHCVSTHNLPPCDELGTPELLNAYLELIQNTAHALYTGQLGQGSHAQLIAYEHALMFAPTQDVITPPSYSQGGRDYWVQAP